MKHQVILAILFLAAAAVSGCSRKDSPAQVARDSVAGAPPVAAVPPESAEPTTRAARTNPAPVTNPAPDSAGLPVYEHSGALARDLSAVKVAAARTGPAIFDTSMVGDLALVSPPGKSILEGKLPPEPPNPEREYIRQHGRRDAPVTRTPLTGGKDSADDLARAILAAIADNDFKGIHLLRITESEFENIFWPEFPQSAPYAHNVASDAWFYQVNEMNDGAKALLGAEGGTPLVFDRLDCVAGRMRYRNFNLYAGMIIVAHRPDDTEVRLRHAWIFCERLGKWKVYMYDDQSHGEYLAEYPPTE